MFGAIKKHVSMLDPSKYIKKYDPAVKLTRMGTGYEAAKTAERDAKRAQKAQKEQRSMIAEARQREELRLAEAESEIARRKFRAKTPTGRASLLGA